MAKGIKVRFWVADEHRNGIDQCDAPGVDLAGASRHRAFPHALPIGAIFTLRLRWPPMDWPKPCLPTALA